MRLTAKLAAVSSCDDAVAAMWYLAWFVLQLSGLQLLYYSCWVATNNAEHFFSITGIPKKTITHSQFA